MATDNMHKNMVKSGYVVWVSKIRFWTETDRQTDTDRHAHHNTLHTSQEQRNKFRDVFILCCCPSVLRSACIVCIESLYDQNPKIRCRRSLELKERSSILALWIWKKLLIEFREK